MDAVPPALSTFCSPHFTWHHHTWDLPGLPLHIYTLKAIKYWRWRRPGTEASVILLCTVWWSFRLPTHLTFLARLSARSTWSTWLGGEWKNTQLVELSFSFPCRNLDGICFFTCSPLRMSQVCQSVAIILLSFVYMCYYSERASATGAEGIRLKEGGSINKSLVCLGNVISALGMWYKNVPCVCLASYKTVSPCISLFCNQFMLSSLSLIHWCRSSSHPTLHPFLTFILSSPSSSPSWHVLSLLPLQEALHSLQRLSTDMAT